MPTLLQLSSPLRVIVNPVHVLMRCLHCSTARHEFRTDCPAAGLGRKSVACILLLCLRAHDFPVDTNVGRICARMGWLPFDQEKPLEVGCLCGGFGTAHIKCTSCNFPTYSRASSV